MKKIPIALQLWSINAAQQRDFAAATAAVAAIGYAGVELAGYGNLDAKGAKAALDAAGLRIAGMHVGLDRLTGQLDAVIDEALLLGARDLTCPWWSPGQLATPAACEKAGERLGAIGAVLRACGLRFSFHHHSHELRLVEGRTALEWMLDAAAPRDLSAEVDVHWAHEGGQAPDQLLRRLGARVPLIHLKDAKELGTGPVDFARVFAAADAIGSAEWFIVEQEDYNHEPLHSVRLCFEQVKRWGRA